MMDIARLKVVDHHLGMGPEQRCYGLRDRKVLVQFVQHICIKNPNWTFCQLKICGVVM